LVRDPDNIRLAMLGMVAGNGHPFSWSAIINGEYDADQMARCSYPVIPQYLGAAPRGSLGIPGVRVTHVWCDDSDDAWRVAGAARIGRVVDRPTDVIGHVDAVVIPTDVGDEHVERARPFVEAGLPVFIDKPLTDRPDHLEQFLAWNAEGRAICSSSCMRYAREFTDLRSRLASVGALRLIVITMAKSWERYGIHALEAIYPLLPPGGWRTVVNTGNAEANVVHLRHGDGVDIVIPCIQDLYGGFAHLGIWGTESALTAKFSDTLYAFREQLLAFVHYLRSGQPPVPFSETVELVRLLIAGTRSRDEGGRVIELETLTRE
jgi:predicted dehydrogenase